MQATSLQLPIRSSLHQHQHWLLRSRLLYVIPLVVLLGQTRCVRFGFEPRSEDTPDSRTDLVGGRDLSIAADMAQPAADTVVPDTITAVDHEVLALLVDRGLPSANLNNAASALRSNVQWGMEGLYFNGDDFTIGTAGETYVIDTVRLWTAPAKSDQEPPALGDWFESVALAAGPAGGGALQPLASGSFAQGEDQTDNPNISVLRVSYPDNPGSKYQGSSGAYFQIFQIEFSRLQWQVAGGTKYWFGMQGAGRQVPGAPEETYIWFNHASNGPLSGTPQEGADGLLHDFSPSRDFLDSFDTADSSLGLWDKSCDINIQVLGNRIS
jgi:hypothetical protein